MNINDQIREHLRKLGNKEVEPKRPKSGICSEIEDKFGIRVLVKLKDLMQEWPNSSGSRVYPVRSPGIYPDSAYLLYKRDMWNPYHPYGAARLRLCLWLADNWEDV